MWLNDGDLYINNNNEKHIFLYKVNLAGKGKCNKDLEVYRDNTFNHSVVHYILSGEGKLIINNNTYKIKPGNLFILPPFTAHKYLANFNNPFHAHWVEISGGLSAEIITNITKINGFVFFNKFNSEVHKKISIIHNELKKDYDKFFISNCINELITVLVQIMGDENIEINDMKNINKVVEYINENYMEQLTYEKISKISNYSYSYFLKLFKDVRKETPSKYIERVRINKAKEILYITDYSIEQVSEMVGFSNSNYFIKRFKNSVGITPMSFRTQHKR